MSIILDALRKSEAARRRAEAPDLFTTLPPPPAPDARAHRERGLWRAGAVVVVITLFAAAWWWLQRTPEAPATIATADNAGPASPPAVLPPPVATDAPAVGPAMPPPTAQPPAPVPAATVPAAMPPAGPVVDVPPKSRPLPATPSEAPAAVPGVPASPAPAPPAPPSSSSGDPLPLARLDAGTRKQLPPLRVSMHLYDADPSRRFIILDDKRLGEGDLSGEIVVERIDRDGAVLAWRGTRLRIAPP